LRECETKLCSLSSKKALEGEEIIEWMDEVWKLLLPTQKDFFVKIAARDAFRF
jgi:hypothetical protein